jgi:hypothetical protein
MTGRTQEELMAELRAPMSSAPANGRFIEKPFNVWVERPSDGRFVRVKFSANEIARNDDHALLIVGKLRMAFEMKFHDDRGNEP